MKQKPPRQNPESPTEPPPTRKPRTRRKDPQATITHSYELVDYERAFEGWQRTLDLLRKEPRDGR